MNGYEAKTLIHDAFWYLQGLYDAAVLDEQTFFDSKEILIKAMNDVKDWQECAVDDGLTGWS